MSTENMPISPKYSRAILFDLDNTLTHRLLSIERYCCAFVASFGSSLDHIPVSVISKIVAQADHGGYLPKGSPYSSIRDAIGAALSNALPRKSPTGADLLAMHWATYFPKSAMPMPGAMEAIRELESLGFAVAVVSNGAHRTRTETIDVLAFASSIRAVVSSELAGVKKPSPKIFHQAANELGVKPRECIYVGDHPENDYWGAISAGMRAVWLRGFHAWPSTRARAGHEIGNLSELPRVIMTMDRGARLDVTLPSDVWTGRTAHQSSHEEILLPPANQS